MTIQRGSVFFLPMFFVSSLEVVGGEGSNWSACTIAKYWLLDTDRC